MPGNRPNHRPAAGGLRMSNPPASRVTLAALAVALLLVLIPAVSAETIIDETFSVSIDTSGYASYTSITQIASQPYQHLVLNHIENHPHLNYIGATVTGGSNYPTEGSHAITYTIPGGMTGDGVMYVDYGTNALGVTTGCKYTFFFYDWNVGSLTGRKMIALSSSYGTFGAAGGSYVSTSTVGGLARNEGTGLRICQVNTFTVVSRNEFANHLSATSDDGAYNIQLTRMLNGVNYASAFNILKNDVSTYYDFSGNNLNLYSSTYEADSVKVVAPDGTTFIRSLGATGPSDPSAPSTVPVNIVALDSRTGNLLLDAAVEVYNETGDLIATGSTSPNGWYPFTYTLPATLTDEDFEKFYAVNITLDGWTQKVEPYVFYPAMTPRTGDWIRVEMLPAATGPADPENTYLMFYVRDTSGNGLPGAYVSIDGEYWSTNSAGHVAAEVAKNATYPYTVSKQGYMTISGSATVEAASAYTVNVVLGAGELPTLTPEPGATPTPDTRSPIEKAASGLDYLLDNAENFGIMAGMILMIYMCYWMVPKK